MTWSDKPVNAFFETGTSVAICLSRTLEVTTPVRIFHECELAIVTHSDSFGTLIGYEFIFDEKMKFMFVGVLAYAFARPPIDGEEVERLFDDNYIAIVTSSDEFMQRNFLIGLCIKYDAKEAGP